ncbi:MAG: DNA polymerase IV [Nitrososphaerota archaeon]|nr:DNA polymerase IV [Nitrososphaerota archaeon]
MTRVIGHIDLDYFYAQVEEVEDPSLKQRPVMVCVFSGRTEDSGVVATANYRAREFGVHSAMPIVQAKKKLEGRDPAIIRMDHEKYEVISVRIMDALENMVDTLEPTGIDEAFFELTSSTAGDYAQARERAGAIKKAIFDGEHLTSSVGLGRSKAVAKLGSDMSKPNGLTVVLPEDTAKFLAPIPASKLYGVGPKTSASLAEMGISTVAELVTAEPAELEKRFGRKFRGYLLAAATGTDDSEVVEGLEPTQFSRIVTLKHDTRDLNEILDQLSSGIDYVHEKLVTTSKSFKTITAIGILTDLSTRTKSRSLEVSLDDPTTLRGSILSLFEELGKSTGTDFRRVGIRVSGLSTTGIQGSLNEFLRPAR